MMNDSREGASHDSPEETFAVPDERDVLEPLSLELIAKRFTRFFWQVAALVGACVLLLTVATGTAGWYTSRSQFCSSCHIMEPYYQFVAGVESQGCSLHQVPFSTWCGRKSRVAKCWDCSSWPST